MKLEEAIELSDSYKETFVTNGKVTNETEALILITQNFRGLKKYVKKLENAVRDPNHTNSVRIRKGLKR